LGLVQASEADKEMEENVKLFDLLVAKDYYTATYQMFLSHRLIED
jgi:hypothetical protein